MCAPWPVILAHVEVGGSVEITRLNSGAYDVKDALV